MNEVFCYPDSSLSCTSPSSWVWITSAHLPLNMPWFVDRSCISWIDNVFTPVSIWSIQIVASIFISSSTSSWSAWARRWQVSSSWCPAPLPVTGCPILGSWRNFGWFWKATLDKQESFKSGSDCADRSGRDANKWQSTTLVSCQQGQHVVVHHRIWWRIQCDHGLHHMEQSYSCPCRRRSQELDTLALPQQAQMAPSGHYQWQYLSSFAV